jgi:copper homeostasis protein
MKQVLVEVCVGSLADVEASVAAGADRLELCGALELGGLTPSLGLAEAALSVSPVPVVVMVRPRAGGFRYDRHEFDVMLRDAGRFLEMGASGIVFGILDTQGRIDVPRSRELVGLAGPFESVFHRAFDFVGHPEGARRSALEALIEMGCTRVLTSGGKSTASEGAVTIGEMIAHAAGRIQILPAGGINAENVAQIVQATGANQVHIGASAPQSDGSITGAPSIQICDGRFMQGTAYRAVAGEVVAATVAALSIGDVSGDT